MNGLDMYILVEREPVLEEDVIKWGEWMGSTKDRVIKKTRLEVSIGGLFVKDRKLGFVEISTVFLGVDHSFGSGPQLLFETMVFGGELDQEQDRCSTWEAAEKMHKAMCYRVMAEGA